MCTAAPTISTMLRVKDLKWEDPPLSLVSLWRHAMPTYEIAKKAIRVYEVSLANEIKYWYTRETVDWKVIPTLLWVECLNYRRHGMIRRIHQHWCVEREKGHFKGEFLEQVAQALNLCGFGLDPINKYQRTAAEALYFHTIREAARKERRILLTYARE